MWSGPRNISTALMRSFGNRPDCAVTDEPLYAHYLSSLSPRRRAEHPAADEVMRSQPTDAASVITHLLGPAPLGRAIWYQKHMAHHLTPGMDLRWIDGLTNALLIREPREVIVSFSKVINTPTPADLGFPQQVALLERIIASGRSPIVIDSRTILTSPRGALAALCAALGIGFDESMLQWPPGPRATDGVWAPHWYANVNASTGFAPYAPRHEPVPPDLEPVLAACEPLYQQLREHAITPVQHREGDDDQCSSDSTNATAT